MLFLDQGSNPDVLHWQVDYSPPSHLGSPLSHLNLVIFSQSGRIRTLFSINLYIFLKCLFCLYAFFWRFRIILSRIHSWSYMPLNTAKTHTLHRILINNSEVGNLVRRLCLQFRRPWFDSWVRSSCWRRQRLPTPVFWPVEFHGLYSP